MSLYSPCCIPSENKIGFFWQPPSLPFVLDLMVGLSFTFQILLCTIVVLWDLQIPEVSNPTISFGVCAEIWIMDQIHKG